MTLESGFWQALVSFRSPDVFNPWCDSDPMDLRPVDTGPSGRLARLQAHFSCEPRLLLIGEAPGYQGCHFAGIPFTNEALLLRGAVPRIQLEGRLTSRPLSWSEPSATIMWGALHDLGIADQVVLWNAFAWHPHKPGKLYSNRAPTREELEAGLAVLEAVLECFRGARLIAVGKVAAKTLAHLGHEPHSVLRHPSMGGATEFRGGLRGLVQELRADAGRGPEVSIVQTA